MTDYYDDEDFEENHPDSDTNRDRRFVRQVGSLLYWMMGIFTGSVGYTLYEDGFLAVISAVCWPLAWSKWLILHEVSLEVIKASVSWFSASWFSMS